MIGDPDLFSIVLRLRPEPGSEHLHISGHGVHAMFLDLVRQVDPELSQALHEKMMNKHFTVAALPPYGSRFPLEVRVTLMGSHLFPPFSQALLQQTVRPTLRIGRTAMRLEDVFGMPGSHQWSGYAQFAQLAASAQPTQILKMQFYTPTFTTQGSLTGGNKQRLNMLPLPEAIFGSLARRWNDLAPPALVIDYDRIRSISSNVLISRYRLETVAHQLRTNVQVGFIGNCTYELLPDDVEVQREFATLADAAFYLGVGAKTTQGFGVCRRVSEESHARN